MFCWFCWFCFADLKWSKSGLPPSGMVPAQPGCLLPLLWDWTDLGLYCGPSWAHTDTCHRATSRPKTVLVFVWVIFQWADSIGFIFSSLLSSWSLWSEEHQCQHRPWAQLCLMWYETIPAAFCQLRADLAAGEHGEGVGDAPTFESTSCA